MGSYSVVRSVSVAAPVHEVHALIDDFHAWTQWSPWEDLDPELRRTYSGSERGVGAVYQWSGNRKAGQGRMEITRSKPESVEVALDFLKPFKSSSTSLFGLAASGNGTTVEWRMTGEQKGLMSVLGRVYSMDKLIGPDFEKGLARLKAVAEKAP